MTTRTFPWTFESAALTSARGPLAIAGLWVLQIAAAMLFIMAGSAKLADDPAMVQVFGAIGVGQWFRYLTGAIEVVGGVLLLVPSLAAWAALALAVTMIGAVATHLFVTGGSAASAVVLLAVLAIVAWARKDSLKSGHAH
jgi:uncharacterized membrane protein YphA (DoxX/SURF4 family)